MTSCWKAFGVPFITRLHDIANGSDIQNLFLNLMKPFLRPGGTTLNDDDNTVNNANGKGIEMGVAMSSPVSIGGNPTDELREGSLGKIQLELYLTDEKGAAKISKLEMNGPVSVTGGRLYVHACWPDKTIEQYDMRLLNSLPEVFKPGFSKRLQESISLYTCLEAFLKEEPLGPEDMWLAYFILCFRSNLLLIAGMYHHW